MCKKAETTVSCKPAAVAWARRWALAKLRSIYAGLDEASMDIQTVVSELVTNAIQADCHDLTLALDAHHSYVRIATKDDAPGEPVKQHPTLDMARGRGLLIVDALARRWGVEHEAEGKTVWVEVALADSAGPTFACEN
jgi:anti-sigma regulatory factor (Ser/Thr protein kinase)